MVWEIGEWRRTASDLRLGHHIALSILPAFVSNSIVNYTFHLPMLLNLSINIVHFIIIYSIIETNICASVLIELCKHSLRIRKNEIICLMRGYR